MIYTNDLCCFAVGPAKAVECYRCLYMVLEDGTEIGDINCSEHFDSTNIPTVDCDKECFVCTQISLY